MVGTIVGKLTLIELIWFRAQRDGLIAAASGLGFIPSAQCTAEVKLGICRYYNLCLSDDIFDLFCLSCSTSTVCQLNLALCIYTHTSSEFWGAEGCHELSTNTAFLVEFSLHRKGKMPPAGMGENNRTGRWSCSCFWRLPSCRSCCCCRCRNWLYLSNASPSSVSANLVKVLFCLESIGKEKRKIQDALLAHFLSLYPTHNVVNEIRTQHGISTDGKENHFIYMIML